MEESTFEREEGSQAKSFAWYWFSTKGSENGSLCYPTAYETKNWHLWKSSQPCHVACPCMSEFNNCLVVGVYGPGLSGVELCGKCKYH